MSVAVAAGRRPAQRGQKKAAEKGNASPGKQDDDHRGPFQAGKDAPMRTAVSDLVLMTTYMMRPGRSFVCRTRGADRVVLKVPIFVVPLGPHRR